MFLRSNNLSQVITMKALKNLHRDQSGMTGLETAIILIAFVTVAAVFGYAVLSAGLFSAERGKETIYAGLNEAKSNVELSGSVIGLGASDNVSLGKVKFTVKNAIAGNPIDITECNGTSSAANKMVISLTTKNDYKNDVKWSKAFIGNNNGNNLLETGEQCEITVDLSDLGVPGALSQNLGANDTFSIQVKPSLGSTITIQRTLPAAIAPVMDLDLGTNFGGTGRSGGGSTPGGGGTPSLICTDVKAACLSNQVIGLIFSLKNNGTTPVTISQSGLIIAVNGGSAVNPNWGVDASIISPPIQIAAGDTCDIGTSFTSPPRLTLLCGDTFTATVTPDGGSMLSITKTIPITSNDGLLTCPNAAG